MFVFVCRGFWECNECKIGVKRSTRLKIVRKEVRKSKRGEWSIW